MRKAYVALAGLSVVLLLGGAYLAISKPLADREQTDGQMTVSSSRKPGSQDGETAGAYVDYQPGIIEMTTGTKILFFHAPWCPQCRKLEQSIQAGKIPNGVTIIKVDYDSNQVLRQQYGVTIQTTLVRVDDNGALVKRYVAYDTPSLATVTEQLLP